MFGFHPHFLGSLLFLRKLRVLTLRVCIFFSGKRFFGQTRYASFQRQCNIYGFNRFLQGKDKGGYYHLCFVRDNRPLVRGMVRRKIKGRGSNKQEAQDLIQEQIDIDFYDPAWIDHKEASIPSVLIKKQQRKHNRSVKIQQERVVVSPGPLVSRRNTDTSATSPKLFAPEDSEHFSTNNNTMVGRDFAVVSESPSCVSDTTSSSSHQQNGNSRGLDFLADDEMDHSAASNETAVFEGYVFHVLDEPTPCFVPSANDKSLLSSAPDIVSTMMEQNPGQSNAQNATLSDEPEAFSCFCPLPPSPMMYQQQTANHHIEPQDTSFESNGNPGEVSCFSPLPPCPPAPFITFNNSGGGAMPNEGPAPAAPAPAGNNDISCFTPLPPSPTLPKSPSASFASSFGPHFL